VVVAVEAEAGDAVGVGDEVVEATAEAAPVVGGITTAEPARPSSITRGSSVSNTMVRGAAALGRCPRPLHSFLAMFFSCLK
jgi:hypothetical protein